ncbi:MAG: hypothetical protein JWO04_1474 [Gammaproteobacteria bacterium]|nr:hypothetical protein [Gammaproteobacteria bacterium]
MDMGSISAAVSSLKVAGDIARGLISLKTMTEVQSKAIELNQQILDAQHQIFAANAAQTTLVERIRELESQVSRMKDWDAQKQRYKLAAPFPGCMVYALLKPMSEGQPPHYLCTSCFQKGEPSILQGREGRHSKDGWAYAMYCCPNSNCRSEAKTGSVSVVAPQYFEDIQPSG